MKEGVREEQLLLSDLSEVGSPRSGAFGQEILWVKQLESPSGKAARLSAIPGVWVMAWRAQAQVVGERVCGWKGVWVKFVQALQVRSGLGKWR